MMNKKILIGLILALVTVMSTAALISAQAFNGSIRGTVYMDTNGNGVCGPEENEVTHPGVPIEFVSDDGEYTTYLATGDDGTYGLVAAAYGTWKVSARPNANDFVVTSEPTLNVFVGSEEPVALNINFCIQATDAEATADTATTTSNAVLPQAGGQFDSTLYIIAAVLGAGFMVAGAFYSLRRN